MTRSSVPFRHFGSALSGCLAILAILVCTLGAARAQVSPFRGYSGPTLPKQDLEAGTKAAGRLLGSDPKPVGAVETWTGPASGNSGTLTIERAYQRQGRECRDIRSHVTYKTGSERSFLFHACRVSGQWKLVD